MTDSKFLKVAKQAAIEAGKIIEKYSHKEHELFDKGKVNDFATQADLEAEKIIKKIIKSHFPSHNIIAEETGETDNNSEFTWAIDPVDGTIPFTTGLPVYSVSIALLVSSQPIIGVIYNVALEEIYWAEKGQGSFVNKTPIKVNLAQELSESLIGFDFGHVRRKERLKKYLEPLVSKIRFPFVIGAGAMSLAYIARGYLDGYIFDGFIWDYAAGAIIIKEAGGKITNFQGKAIDWSQKNIEILASNGLIHNEMVKAYN